MYMKPVRVHVLMYMYMYMKPVRVHVSEQKDRVHRCGHETKFFESKSINFIVAMIFFKSLSVDYIVAINFSIYSPLILS